MNMKDETAAKLLEIAATLAAATIASSTVPHVTKTRGGRGTGLPEMESTFGDCLDTVRINFEDLTAGRDS